MGRTTTQKIGDDGKRAERRAPRLPRWTILERSAHILGIIVMLFVVYEIAAYALRTNKPNAVIEFINQPFPVDQASYKQGSEVSYTVERRITNLQTVPGVYNNVPELVSSDGCNISVGLLNFQTYGVAEKSSIRQVIPIPRGIPAGRYQIEGVSYWASFAGGTQGFAWKTVAFNVLDAEGNKSKGCGH